MGGVTGRDQLAKLGERIKYLASSGFRTETAQVLSVTTMKLVPDEFRASRGPYGELWAPVSRDQRGPGRGRSGPVRYGKPLLLTGQMRASLAVAASANGFRVELTKSYSKYHQYGTRAHQRASRAARQSARGRFVNRRAKTAFLLRISAHRHGGIPQRQILPMPSTGGLGPIWLAAFNRDVVALAKRRIKAAV